MLAKPLVSIVILSMGNERMLQECLRSIGRATDPERTPFELIVLFQQASQLSTEAFASDIDMRKMHSLINLGFGGGNNYAARTAVGKYLLFLNDDVTVADHWLSNLVSAAESDENVGAVGSRILFPDGRLQEAGSILWSDGSCYPVGRGTERDSIAHSYRRDVHFASANGLLVRADAFRNAGGFDERYFPAYYEDVDLCLTLRHRLGLRVLYEPGSIVYHHESVTANRDPQFREFLFRRNRALLCEKWRKELPYYPAAQPESHAAIERAIVKARGCSKRALVLDDRVPQIGLGSGFGRTSDMLLELSAAGYAVDFVPTDRGRIPRENPLAAIGVQVVPEALPDFLSAGIPYDVVIVSRPHNFKAFYSLLRWALPGTPIIYDAEALYHRRLFLQARSEVDHGRLAQLLDEAEAMQVLEAEIARSVDAVVAISDSELEWFQGLQSPAKIFFARPLSRDVRPLPPNLENRSGAVFVSGWLAGEDSPNVQALKWYVERVVPQVTKVLPNFVTRVTGGDPPLTVQRLESDAVLLTGFAPDLRGIYGGARLAIAPILAGAGVKIKTIEALQFGVPVVATTVGAEGLPVVDGTEIDISDDPEEFAKRIVALATDDELWLRRREVIDKTVGVWESERLTWGELVACVLKNHATSTPVIK